MRTDTPGTASPLSGGSGFRFAIVFSRFNQAITESLRDGAQRALQEAGARAADVEVVSVPGAFELPQAARSLAAFTGAADMILERVTPAKLAAPLRRALRAGAP